MNSSLTWNRDSSIPQCVQPEIMLKLHRNNVKWYQTTSWAVIYLFGCSLDRLGAKEASNRFSNDSIHNSFRIWLPNKFTPVTCCTYKLMVFWAQHALFIDVFEQLCHGVSHRIASSARYRPILVKRHSNSEKIFINRLQIHFVWSNDEVL